jgi:Insertion element 4 transposase N-terminal/Transposase DDE domain
MAGSCSVGAVPRSGWVKPVSDRRLSDLVAFGLLTQVFPPDLVDEVIAQSGRTQQRSRSLPARVMAYFAIGMGLYSDGSYEQVMSQVTDGLSWVSGWQERSTPPSKSAIFQARARLGPEPLQALFARVANPLGTGRMAGVWLAGRRLVAIDDTCLDLQDTALNAAFFGRPQVNREGKSLLPQLRLVALAECGSNAIFEAVVGACTGSEVALAGELIERLKPGMLLLANRATCSYPLWHNAIDTGADLLWRVESGLSPERRQTLGDGSWLALIRPADDRETESVTVRVIDCPRGEGSDRAEPCQLLTTILDSTQASATELAAAYAHRWKIELALNELKTNQSGPRAVLRSKSPELVLQEIWGYLCCHYAIRTMMSGVARPVPATARRA